MRKSHFETKIMSILHFRWIKIWAIFVVVVVLHQHSLRLSLNHSFYSCNQWKSLIIHPILSFLPPFFLQITSIVSNAKLNASCVSITWQNVVQSAGSRSWWHHQHRTRVMYSYHEFIIKYVCIIHVNSTKHHLTHRKCDSRIEGEKEEEEKKTEWLIVCG